MEGVCSTVRRPERPCCGALCRWVHDSRDKKVRDWEVSGRPVTLVWSRWRLACEGCGRRFLENHPVFEGSLTARLARRIVADAQVMTLASAVRRHQVGSHMINALGWGAWAAIVGERRRAERCRVLLVDETSIRKRHRYVTVIVNADTGRTLAMIPHRSTAALSAFRARQGHRWCRGVKVVVSDGSKAYKTAIERRLGHALHVLDQFACDPMVQRGTRRGAPRRPAPHPAGRHPGIRP